MDRLSKVRVIAECGVNWDTIDDMGTLNAVDMIYAAKAAKADYVKFQLYNKTTIKDSPLAGKLKERMLTEEGVKHLKEVADKKEIGFILTPMYIEAIEIAAKYADYIKIRYADHQNEELVAAALKTGKPLLVSCPYPPLEAHLAFNPRVNWLYCIPLYPPRIEDFNLDVASTCHGFSSHYPHTVCDLAYAINTSYEESFIEKHVMLNPEKLGYPIDADVSVTFQQLAEFIKQLRLIERIRRTRL